MSKNIGVSDLVKALGDDKIMLQPLNPGVTNLRQKKEYNEVTFATETTFDLNGLRKVGLVLWIDPADFDAAKKQLGI